jgi:hypothetical protein
VKLVPSPITASSSRSWSTRVMPPRTS